MPEGVDSKRHRALAFLCVATLSLLALEGAFSIAGQPSPMRVLGDAIRSGDPSRAGDASAHDDAFRERAAARIEGLLRLHPDPLVGYTLRTNARLAIHDGTIHTDDLGLRRRPAGTDEPEDALRIAVVGASIPLGFGVDDDETIAHQLEVLLRDVQGPSDGRPVICRTVAAGRWSHRNAVQFLLDHWSELRPDIVLYMPFDNDLGDTDIVHESGFRQPWPDVASADPWLRVTAFPDRFMLRVDALGKQGVYDLQAGTLGPKALTADISAESSRRFDEAVASIERLHRHTRRMGGRMALLQYTYRHHRWNIQRRLIKRGLDLPVIPLFAEVEGRFTLGFDPHPNAASHRTMALWIAESLLAAGWVEGAEHRELPDVDDAYRNAREPAHTADEVLAAANEARAYALEACQAEIDFETGCGLAQIYGGVSPSGLAGMRVLAMVARAGAELQVSLDPVPDRPDLYPLEVTVEADGRVVGRILIQADARAHATFELPAPSRPLSALEVTLTPKRWVVERIMGTSEVVSFRPVRIACVAAGS